MAVQVIST